MSLTKQPHIKTPLPSATPFKTAYGEKIRVALSFPENSRWTKQSFRDECDINNVMGRYMSTGEMPVINQQAPQYLDVSGLDYQHAMEFVAGAQSLFNEMPSDIRNRFGNDPALFLDFCNDEKNRPEMAEMGLLSDAATYAYMEASNTPEKPLKSPETATPENPVKTGSGQ